jgi:MscS family membrane protein
LSLFIVSTLLQADIDYPPFIKQQVAFIKKMNEDNSTQKDIEAIVKQQDVSYEKLFERMMTDKEHFIKNAPNYSSEMFALQRVIKINKRANYKYAVLRDEIKLKSYKLLTNQVKLIKNILTTLQSDTYNEFDTKLNQLVTQNSLANKDIVQDDYGYLLKLDVDSKNIDEAKKNLEELQMLKDENDDFILHLYKFEGKLYTFNMYANYHILGLVLMVDNLAIVKLVDPLLSYYGLNVMKIIFIVFSIALIYLLRKLLYMSVEYYVTNVESSKAFLVDILQAIRRTIHLLIVMINANVVIYIYNNFTTIETVSKVFNIIYTVIITLLVYIVVNTIAKIKIETISLKEKKIKNEIINVGIKIVNFIILVVGLLVVLHFAGADLSTVLSGLGIGGFAVALAAKDSLANFFGTLSILISDVFSQGDWIVIDGEEGVVVEIGLRVTTLRTFDNALIAIPNGTLANKDVKNWNKRRLGRRIKMSLGIKYDSKTEDIKNAVNQIRKMLDKHPGIATQNTQYSFDTYKSAKLVSKDDLVGVKKTLLVYLDEFSDSSINILVYCFTKTTNWQEWLETKEDVMHKIMEIFEKNNLEFAFPSMSLYNEK